MGRSYWTVVTKNGQEYRFGDNKRQAEMFAEKCNRKAEELSAEFRDEYRVRVVHVIEKY